jgi:hypothetical protein
LSQLSDKFEEHGRVLVARALDIARGGNGQGKAKAPDPDPGNEKEEA